jgi:hypothetical protein
VPTSPARKPSDPALAVVPGALAGGLVGLLLALRFVETTMGPAVGAGPAEVTARGIVFGVTVREETGAFSHVRPAVGQHMRNYSLIFIVTGVAAGAAAGLVVRSRLRRRSEPRLRNSDPRPPT